MSDTTYVTVVAKLVIPVRRPYNDAINAALNKVRDQYPALPWTVENVNQGWGT